MASPVDPDDDSEGARTLVTSAGAIRKSMPSAEPQEATRTASRRSTSQPSQPPTSDSRVRDSSADISLLDLPALTLEGPVAQTTSQERDARRRVPSADENLSGQRRRRQHSGEMRTPVGEAPLPARVAVGGGGGLQIVKPMLPPPTTAMPAAWLPPPAPLDPHVPAIRDRPKTLSGPHPVAEEAPPPAPKLPSPPLSLVVKQSLAAAGGMALLGLVFLVASSGDGYTSKRFTVEEQQRLGALWKAKGIQQWGGMANADVNAAVAAVGAPIAKAMADALDERPVAFLVVKEPNVPQAFGLPEGTVVITAGMLNRLTTQAQLAALLAHTIAHQALGHIDAAIDGSVEADVAVRAALAPPAAGSGELPAINATNVAIAVAVAEAGVSAVNGPHSEAVADELAIDALRALGYETRALRSLIVDGLAPMRRQHANWLAQHPDLPTRMRDLQDLEDAEPGRKTGQAEYQALLAKLNPPAAVRAPAAVQGTAAAAKAPKTPKKPNKKPASTKR